MSDSPSPSAPDSAANFGPRARSRFACYVSLTRLDKPIGIALLLWPTLDALWLAARGWPGLLLMTIFTMGTVLMRSAGCAINDVADRRFDLHVQRTAGRTLARGEIAVWEAIAVAIVLAVCAALMLPLLNPATVPLAFVAVFLTASYPYTKRFFPMPQAYLGIVFSFGIPMAFAAVLGYVPSRAWLLLCANLFWVVAYDTEYAMVDRQDDLRIGIRSSAILFGHADVLVVTACYAIYLGMLAAIARSEGLGWSFALGWIGALACAVAHVAWIRGRDPQQCFRAFRHNHWLGLSIFAGIVGDYALR